MSLPDLCLLPHEVGDLSPGEQLCAPAIARIEIEGQCAGSYLMRVVQCNRAKDQVVVRRESPSSSPLLRLSELENMFDADEIAEYINYSFFTRKLFFDAEARLATSTDRWIMAVEFDTEGRTYWQSKSGRQEQFWLENGDFEHVKIEDFYGATDIQIENILMKIWSDPNSEIGFEMRWSQLSQREKNHLFVGVERGTLEEMERIIRAMLVSESGCRDILSIHGKAIEEDQWSINFPVRSWTYAYDELNTVVHKQIEMCVDIIYGTIIVGECNIVPSHRMQFILDLVSSYFGLIVKEKSIAKNGKLFEKNIPSYILSFAAPTFHERIEAQFQLRDFLRDKVSPIELAELMGE